MTARSGDGAVDFAYLEGFAAGDRQVVDEVLALFVGQAEIWRPGLAAPGAGWRDLVHTIKGSARGIGANPLGDLCARAETEGESASAGVLAALDETLGAIEAYRVRR